MPHYQSSPDGPAGFGHPAFTRSRAARILPAFDGGDVRILDVTLARSEVYEPPVGPHVDAVHVVRGGTAMIVRPGAREVLLDPAHAMLVHAPGTIRIRSLSDGARLTTLLLVREPATAECTAVRRREADGALALGADALLNLGWLQRARTHATHRSAEIAHAARVIHQEALDSASAHSVSDARAARDRGARRALADAARVRLAASVAIAHPLADVAHGLHTSPFHLAHVFREEVGMSMHQHLVRLRLIAALEHLGAGAADLSMLALELGFSNHSHFSVTFRRTFGISPSEARRRLTAASLATVSPPQRAASAQ